MAFHLLSLPTPHSYSPKPTWFRSPQPPPVKPFILLSSSSPSSSSSNSVLEDGLPPQPEASDIDPFPLSGCKACGKEEIEKGCNGEGRIQGGIATVPGFGWWPIKAYRPCPGFVASGGRYFRQGQSMDEVVSGGGGGRRVPVTNPPSSPQIPSRKKSGPRKFKR